MRVLALIWVFVFSCGWRQKQAASFCVCVCVLDCWFPGVSHVCCFECLSARVSVLHFSDEELLQDWNYRLRKPCGNNFEAAKPEEKEPVLYCTFFSYLVYFFPIAHVGTQRVYASFWCRADKGRYRGRQAQVWLRDVFTFLVVDARQCWRSMLLQSCKRDEVLDCGCTVGISTGQGEAALFSI